MVPYHEMLSMQSNWRTTSRKITKSTKTRAGRRAIPFNETALSALLSQADLTHSFEIFVFLQMQKKLHLPLKELKRINPASFRKHRWSRIIKTRGKMTSAWHTLARVNFLAFKNNILRSIDINMYGEWFGVSTPCV